MIFLPSASPRLAAATLLLAASATVAAKPHKAHKTQKAPSSTPAIQSVAADGPEQALSSVLEAIEGYRLDLATKRVEALLAAHPNFRLGHLIRGDPLRARARSRP